MSKVSQLVAPYTQLFSVVLPKVIMRGEVVLLLRKVIVLEANMVEGCECFELEANDPDGARVLLMLDTGSNLHLFSGKEVRKVATSVKGRKVKVTGMAGAQSIFSDFVAFGVSFEQGGRPVAL